MLVKDIDGKVHDLDVSQVTCIAHIPGTRRKPNPTSYRYTAAAGTGSIYRIHTLQCDNTVSATPRASKDFRAAWQAHLQSKLPF